MPAQNKRPLWETFVNHWLAPIATTVSLISTGVAVTLYLQYPHAAEARDFRQPVLAAANTKASPDISSRNHSSSKALLGASSSLIADVAETVAPSVVNIDIEKSVQRRAIQDFSGFPFGDDVFRRFFGFPPEVGSPFGGPGGGQMAPGGRMPIMQGNGSGLILDNDGHILTNNHVVASADRITVTLNDGRKLPGKVIGKDPLTDLAVLKVDAPSLKPARLGISDRLRPGEWVLAIGSPLGFDHTVTLGIISALSRKIPDLNANVDFIQTDAAINPGNSGGPLVNLNGEVIGINTAISGRGQNIGFAIPVDVARDVADALIKSGRIIRPYIGIAMIELTPELGKSLGVADNTPGVVVAQVVPGSPSSKAGFRQGDIIQRLDGKPVKDAKDVQGIVRQKPLNSTLNFQILREGRLMALSVATAQMPTDGQQGSSSEEMP
jgi:Do/DeqQ family serine protease